MLIIVSKRRPLYGFSVTTFYESIENFDLKPNKNQKCSPKNEMRIECNPIKNNRFILGILNLKHPKSLAAKEESKRTIIHADGKKIDY